MPRQADEKTDASAVVEGVAAAGSTDVTMSDAPAASAPEASTSTSTSTAPAAAAASSSSSTEPTKPKRAGIVLAAEKRVTSKLLDNEAGGGREKIFGINECVAARHRSGCTRTAGG